MQNQGFRVTSKNLIPLCILRVLENYSDESHPLTQEQIIAHLRKDFGIEQIERKAVGRAVSRLEDELGYEFEKSRDGIWLSGRIFDNAELQMLVDSVFAARFINKKYSHDIIEKLLTFGSNHFRRNVKYVCSMDNLGKDDGAELFLSVGTINEAIEENRQISFDYCKYGADLKLHTSSSHIVSPYRLIMKRGEYYLMMYHEKYGKINFYKVGRMKNIEILNDRKATPLKSVEGWEQGIRNDTFVKRPFLFSDDPQRIVFLVKADAFDYVISDIGRDILLETVAEKDGQVKITVQSSPHAMQYFAQQYAEYVEILSPQSLRDSVKSALCTALEKYEKN